MTNDDDRLAELALRAAAGELTVPPGTSRRGAEARAEAHALLFDHLLPLPEGAVHSLFGPTTQRVVYVHYAEGPYSVGVVLDPPTALHAPSPEALERNVRALVAAARDVAIEDVHAFGKTVEPEVAVRILRELVLVP